MTGTQALAERLHDLAAREAVGIVVENDVTESGITARSRACEPADHLPFAAAILADGSVYLTPAEAARVAAIEETAREIVEGGPHRREAPMTDTSLRMRLGPFPNELDVVRSIHKRQEVATPDDHSDVMCAVCYILDEGWPCAVARLIAVLDEQIAAETPGGEK